MKTTPYMLGVHFTPRPSWANFPAPDTWFTVEAANEEAARAAVEPLALARLAERNEEARRHAERGGRTLRALPTGYEIVECRPHVEVVTMTGRRGGREWRGLQGYLLGFDCEEA